MQQQSSLVGKHQRGVRSRAACGGCRQTKQKCDGPSRIPCRRCELYDLECDYQPVAGSTSSKPNGTSSRPISSVQKSTERLPPISSLSQRPTAYSTNETSNDLALHSTLLEILDRVRSLESSMSNVRLAPSSNESSPLSVDSSDPLVVAVGPYIDTPPAASSPSPRAADNPTLITSLPGHALQNISATVDYIEALEKLKGSSTAQKPGEMNGHHQSSSFDSMLPDTYRPDVIDRGILSVAEVEANFKVFFRLLAPWIIVFDLSQDMDALRVRERSPLLFHAILTSTSYYLMSTGQRELKIYKALVALTNELLAPIIVSTQVHDLNGDLARALCLLILYKPVQFSAFHYSGRVHTAERAEHYAKINTTSSFILWGIVGRVATRIGLHLVPNHFTKTYSPTAPIATSTMGDLRLWIYILIIDNHAALTIGRQATLDTTDALRVTRLFASLNLQAGDVRIAALLELYAVSRQAVAKPWFTDFTKRAPAHDLRKFNRDLDDWEQYWADHLEKAANEGDALALHPLYVVSKLVRAIVNSTVFMRWQSERRASLAKGHNDRPELSTQEWESLQITLTAVEAQIFSLSVESRVEGSNRRQVQWSTQSFDIPRGGRPLLNLDQTVVDMHRTAFDPIICVAFIYPLLLIARMCNAALANCEMKVKDQNAYNNGSLSLNKPQYLLSTAKFARLLELASRFLDAVAPTPSHPAKRHARILRAMFVVGSVDLSQVVTHSKRGPTSAPATTEHPDSTQGASTPHSEQSSSHHYESQASNLHIPPYDQAAQSLQQAPLMPNSSNNSNEVSSTIVTDPLTVAGEMLQSLLSGIDLALFDQEMSSTLGGPVIQTSTNLDPHHPGTIASSSRATTASVMNIDWNYFDQTVDPLAQFQPNHQVSDAQMDYFEMLARQGQI